MFRPGQTWPTILALFACAILVVVPAAGVTFCLQTDGVIELGLGVGVGCPCPSGEDHDHPPCTDVDILGLRDRVAISNLDLDLDFVALVAATLATPVAELPSTAELAATAEPPDPHPSPSAMEGALARELARATRAVVVLVI